MNDLMTAYDKARFGKVAQEGQPQAPQMELTPELRSIRNSIEESMRQEYKRRSEALEAAEWAQGQLTTPQESSWGVPLAAAGTGAGALIGSVPSTKSMQQLVRGTGGRKALMSIMSDTLGATPKGLSDVEIAHSLMPDNWKTRLMSRVSSKYKPDPSVVSQMTRGANKPYSEALRRSIGGETGRHRLTTALKEKMTATKGGFAKSPIVKGGLKGSLAAFAISMLPDLFKRIKGTVTGVDPRTYEAQQLAYQRLQHAEALRRWREAQLAMLERARATGALTRVPFSPFSEARSGMSPNPA